MSDDFNLGQLDALDEATLAIRHPATKKPTTWIWTFYGPGHPRTVEVANRVSREALRDLAAQRQARANGKKWKEDVQSPDELQAENVANILARTKGFTPVKLGEQTIEFSESAAREMLSDRKKGWLLSQIIEFLRDEESFIQPSATS